jgi:hypothetical protein
VSEPFRVAVPQPEHDDLARRLELARWPEAYALDGGERVARLDRIKGLLERWRSGYDWRYSSVGAAAMTGAHMRRASTSTSRR